MSGDETQGDKEMRIHITRRKSEAGAYLRGLGDDNTHTSTT